MRFVTDILFSNSNVFPNVLSDYLHMFIAVLIVC